MPPKYDFVRSSTEGLRSISNLSPTANILLLTPVLIPADHDRSTIDPFEAFGRTLSLYHKRIRHVPYLPKTGYTETHAAFLSQADAVIAVICEPEKDKNESISGQMAFAKSTLDAMKDKEANASNMLVLVQCGSEQYRASISSSFVNVMEVTRYDEEIACQLAEAIFKFWP